MRWLRIARKDLRDAIRSRTLYGLVAIFVLTGGMLGYSASLAPDGNRAATLPSALFMITAMLTGLVGVGISYESVVGPRESGSLQVLLGLPYSRGDYVVGTFVGRTTVLAAAIALGGVAALVATLLGGVTPPVTGIVLAVSLSILVAVVFSGIGVGVSAASGSTRSAGAFAFLVTLVLLFFWSALPGLLASAANGFTRPDPLPAWTAVVGTLNPVAALGVLSESLPGFSRTGAVAARTVDSVPFAVGVVCLWLVGPLLLGYLQFRRLDL